MTNIRTYRKLAKIAEASVPSTVTAEYGDSEDFHELFGESIKSYIRRHSPHLDVYHSCNWFASWDDCIQLCASEKDAIAVYLQMTGHEDLIPYDC